MARSFPGAAGGILSYFARHATVANLLFVGLLTLGLLAMPQLRAQFFPDVVEDEIRINVTWEGAGAEDVDAGPRGVGADRTDVRAELRYGAGT